MAGEYPLDDAGCEAIGRAVGTQFAEQGQQIVIACDTRSSSQQIVEIVSKGLVGVGVKVTFVGVIPTPGLAYLTATHDEFVAGVMITASHNTYEFNGVKVFSAQGSKLPDEAEAKLNYDIENGVPNRSTDDFQASPESQLHTDRSLVQEYEDYLVASAGKLRLDGLKLAIDTAHGAASEIELECLSG
ncbi:hypothetical protein IPL68_06685 [Candidatus Saccharibacteria bacterium]|nr:MAG: hypothetical protein IPL68_06685 [Candidatus Saccharibacteria bacterium]